MDWWSSRAVARGLGGGLDLLDVGQLQGFLLFEELDQIGHTISV